MDAPPQADPYRVIYADPPWRFATYSDKGKGRSAEAHYDCLTIGGRVKSGCVDQSPLLQYIVVLGGEEP
jgi:hypothetical protein